MFSFIAALGMGALNFFGNRAKTSAAFQQELMNSQAAVSDAQAASSQATAARADAEAMRSEALATRSDADALRVTATNTGREADMTDLAAELYGLNVDQANTNAKLLRTQAEIARGAAGLAYARERVQEGRIVEEGARTLASQRVFFAGGHFDANSGSPLLAQALTASRVASDVDLSRATAQIEAADAFSRGANIDAQAAGETNKGVSAAYSRVAATLKAGSLRALGFSQFDRADSFDNKADSQDRRAGSLDLRATSYDDRALSFYSRAGGYLGRADDARTAGLFGAATAMLGAGVTASERFPAAQRSFNSFVDGFRPTTLDLMPSNI